jgi:hypothetical protein
MKVEIRKPTASEYKSNMTKDRTTKLNTNEVKLVTEVALKTYQGE